MSTLSLQHPVHDDGINAPCAGSLPWSYITDVDTLKEQMEKHSHDLMRVETNACSMQRRLSRIQDRCESLEASMDASLGRFETAQQRRTVMCDGMKQTLEAVTGRVVEIATGLEILAGCFVGLEERLQKAKQISGTDVESTTLRRQQKQRQLSQWDQPKQHRQQLRQWQRQLQAREQASPESCSPARSSEAPLSPVSGTPPGQSRVAKLRLRSPASSWSPRKAFTLEDKLGKLLDEGSTCASTISSARSDVFSKDLLARITSIANTDISEDLPACIASVVDARVQQCEERILAKLGRAPSNNDAKRTPLAPGAKHLDDSQADVGGLPCVSTQNPKRSRTPMRKEDACQGRPTSRSSSSSSNKSACTLPPPQQAQQHPDTIGEMHDEASLPKPMECQQETAKRPPSSGQSQSECALLSPKGCSLASFTPQDGKNISHPVMLHAASVIREPSAGDRMHMQSGLQRRGIAQLQESPPTPAHGVVSSPSARTRPGVLPRPWASSEPPKTWGSVALLRHPSASHLVPLSPRRRC